MKILFITTQFPYPLDNGGKIGALNGLDSLADHEIYLLSFSEQIECVEKGKEFLYNRLPGLQTIHVIEQDIHIRKKPIILLKRVVQSYFGKLPYMVVKFQNDKMIKEIDILMRDNYFDVVFIDYLNMYSYGEYIQKNYSKCYQKLILKNHNIEHEIFKQACQKAKFIKKIMLIPIWKKTKVYEENALRNADVVLSVCGENTEYFKKINSMAYTMRPTFDFHECQRKYLDNNKLLYVGNLSWKANFEGIQWFVKYVLPLVLDVYPDVTLDIVGSGNIENPFKDINYVKWLGYVEDISNLYEKYQIFVVPLFEGSGIRIKILEAFNYEIPVVSTEHACNTIGVQDGREICIANSAEEFSKAIKELLSNKNKCFSMVQQAKSFLKSNFSTVVRRQEMNSIISEIIKNDDIV